MLISAWSADVCSSDLICIGPGGGPVWRPAARGAAATATGSTSPSTAAASTTPAKTASAAADPTAAPKTAAEAAESTKRTAAARSTGRAALAAGAELAPYPAKNKGKQCTQHAHK